MNQKQKKYNTRKTVFTYAGNNDYTIASDGFDTTYPTTNTTSIPPSCTCPTPTCPTGLK